MKWFERGQLWESRDAARQQGFGQGERRWEGKRPDRNIKPEGRGGPSVPPARRGGPSGPLDRQSPRDRNWRPGGEHRDPRQKYKDAKKAKWQRFKQNIRERQEQRNRGASGHPDPSTFTPLRGDPMQPKADPWNRNPDARPVGKWARDDRRSSWKPQGPPGGRPTSEKDRETFRNRDRSGSSGGQDRRGSGWKPKGPPPGGAPRRDRDEPHDDWHRPPWDRNVRGGFPSKKPFGAKSAGPSHGPKRFGNRKPWAAKPGPKGGDRRPWPSKPGGGRPKSRNKPFGPGGPSRPPGGRRDRGGQWGARSPKKPRGDDE